MPIAEPSCSSGSGPMKRLATNGHAAVLEGAIDVGPVDAYWHLLTQLHHPDLAARVRVLESTVTAPMPAFVANPSVSPEAVDRLATSFQSARDRAWFRPIAAELLIDGFTPVRNINAFRFRLALDRLKRPDIPRRHKQLNQAHRSTHQARPGPGSWKLTGQTTRAARPTRSAEITDLLQTSACLYLGDTQFHRSSRRALISAARHGGVFRFPFEESHHASLHRSDAAHEQRDPASKQTV